MITGRLAYRLGRLSIDGRLKIVADHDFQQEASTESFNESFRCVRRVRKLDQTLIKAMKFMKPNALNFNA